MATEGVVKVFSEAPGTNLLDGSDWAGQFLKAREMGYAPDVLAAPIFVLWEMTAICPQSCVYCYNTSPRKVKELSSKRLFEVADQLVEAKIFNICLSGGEPTARPEYLDLLEYLAVSGIQVGTVLSGWRIDEAKARRITRYASTIQVSLDGSTAEVHDGVRKRKGSFDDAVRAIKLFVGLGTRLSVSFAVTKLNINDFPQTYRLCRELGVSSVRTQKLAISGKVKEQEELCPSEDEYRRLLDFIHEHERDANGERTIEYGDPTTHISYGYEFGLSVMARITAEGYVGLSPYMDVFFGDLKTENFSDLWRRGRKGWHHPRVMELQEKDVFCKDGVVVDAMRGQLFI